MKRVVFVFWLICHIGGFVAASYGVLRGAFETTAIETGVLEPGVFQRGVFDDGLTWLQNRLVSLGVIVSLLPEERALTIQDRKWNAALAILGVVLVAFSIIFNLWHRWLERQDHADKKTRELQRASESDILNSQTSRGRDMVLEEWARVRKLYKACSAWLLIIRLLEWRKKRTYWYLWVGIAFYFILALIVFFVRDPVNKIRWLGLLIFYLSLFLFVRDKALVNTTLLK
jgi:hypothetical protein